MKFLIRYGCTRDRVMLWNLCLIFVVPMVAIPLYAKDLSNQNIPAQEMFLPTSYELTKWLMYMDPAIGLAPSFMTANCSVFNSTTTVNRVCHSAVPTDEEIGRIKNTFGETPFMWAVDEKDKVSRDALEKNGLRYRQTWPVFTMNLDVMSMGTYDQGVSVIEIDAHGKDGARWAAIVDQAFGLPESTMEILLGYLSERASPYIKVYLGYYDHSAVAAGMAIRHGTAITVHWIGTLPEYRHKGLGRAVTLKALVDAQAFGCTQAFLWPSAIGKRMYERMGFTTCDAYAVYSTC